jgi:hypothetical protein
VVWALNQRQVGDPNARSRPALGDKVARQVASIICAVDRDEGARSGVLPDGEEMIQAASQVVLDVEETRPCAVNGDEGARSGVLPDGEETIQAASQVVLDVGETRPPARSVVDVEETRQPMRSWVHGEEKRQPARSVLS